jgi:hippurate hydrolase
MALQSDEPIDDLLPSLVALRRDLHAHPELAFEERRTAGTVAAALRLLGLQVTEGVGGTGVIGSLRHGSSPRAVGLRADMDALPIAEQSRLAHASRHAGVHHGCGHDGHTAMLLGAAQQLARTRRFDGTVHFIFQPAEEGRGGARVMVEQGLFERFPATRLRAAQLARAAARPRADTSRARSWPRPTASTSCCAAAAAMPRSRTARPTCCSRRASSCAAQHPRLAPDRPGRIGGLSVTRVNGGSSHNVLPAEATVTGTVRSFDARCRTASRPRCAMPPPAPRSRMVSRPK